MKLLLTSNGLANKSIVKALIDLVGKPAKEICIAFIPTAMNVGGDDKEWFIDDLINIKKQNFKRIDIVDISALPKEIWLPRLQSVDVLFFSGGNTFHLMYWLKESGLIKLLPKMLETKVWAGISAGSMVTNPALFLSGGDKKAYYKKKFDYESDEALGLVDFYVRPHYNSPHFPQANQEHLEKIAKDIPGVIYALDDNSALKVVDSKVEVISEGESLILNKK